MRSRKFNKTQQGISLLEVLFALLIFAIGALGFAGLQMKALHTSNDANHRARAMLIAQDAVERIQSNPTELARYVTASSWSSPGTTGSCVSPNTCDPDAILNNDVADLAQNAAATLPNGQILVRQCPFNSMSCAVVSWGEQAITDCIGNGAIDRSQNQCLVMEFGR